MKSLLRIGLILLALASTTPVRADLGDRPGDRRRPPKDPPAKPEPDPTPMDEQWKWLLALAVFGMIGFTGWRLWSESKKVRPPKARKPWEFE